MGGLGKWQIKDVKPVFEEEEQLVEKSLQNPSKKKTEPEGAGV